MKKEKSEFQVLEETFKSELKILKNDLRKANATKHKLQMAANNLRDQIHSRIMTIRVEQFGSERYASCRKVYREREGLTINQVRDIFTDILESLYNNDKMYNCLNSSLDNVYKKVKEAEAQIQEVTAQIEALEDDFDAIKRSLHDDMFEYINLDESDSAYDLLDLLKSCGY